MSVKIVEYDPIYDSIELIYSNGKENYPRIIVVNSLRDIIKRKEKGRLDMQMNEVDYEMIEEIVENGGMSWVEKQIQAIQQDLM